MGQLMNRYRGTGGPIVTEIFPIHLVVAAKVIHIHQVCGYFNNVFELSARTSQDVTDVLDHGPSLCPDIETRGSELINVSSGNRVVDTAGARTRHQQEISGTFDVRILAPRLRFSLNEFALDRTHVR